MSNRMYSGRSFFGGRGIDRFRYVGAKAAGVMILGMFILLSALVVATGPQAAPMPRVEREWPVSYSIVQPEALSPTLQVFGKLESDQQATLRAGLTADVKTIVRREGDWVNVGDVILELDDSEAELRLRASRAGLRRAAAELDLVRSDYDLSQSLAIHHEAQAGIAREKLQRIESLYERRMIADAQLDEARHEATERAMVYARQQAELADFPNRIAQAEAAVEEARTKLAQAELDMEHTRVRAPFNGRILNLEVAVGDRISSGSALLQLADYDRLQVRASLPVDIAQRLRNALAQGKKVIARADNAGVPMGFELQGMAGNVKAGQSGIDGFFRVHADANLALGTVINLTLSLPDERDVIAVPMHAIYDNNRVYRIDDSRLQAVAVERIGEHLDAAGNYRILVRSAALAAGDQIMTSQLPTAVSGLLVNPVAGATLADGTLIDADLAFHTMQ